MAPYVYAKRPAALDHFLTIMIYPSLAIDKRFTIPEAGLQQADIRPEISEQMDPGKVSKYNVPTWLQSAVLTSMLRLSLPRPVCCKQDTRTARRLGHRLIKAVL